MTKMDDATIKSWDERELIMNVSHYLNQYANISRGAIALLTEHYNDMANDQIEHFLVMLKEQIENINAVNSWIYVWMSDTKE